MTTNTDPWEPLMTEYGFTTEELREQHTEPYRHDCGRLVVSWPHADEVEVLEDADEDGPLGTEHDCDHSDEIAEEPAEEPRRSLAELLATVDALIPTEPDHTSVPDQPEPAPAEVIDYSTMPPLASPSRRPNTSHAHCDHPATKAARARCRRDRARG